MDDNVVEVLSKFKSLVDKCTRIKNEAYKNYNPEFDSGLFGENRFLVSYSETIVHYLNNSDVVLIVGTFWCVPSNFYQLVTLNVYILENSIH